MTSMAAKSIFQPIRPIAAPVEICAALALFVRPALAFAPVVYKIVLVTVSISTTTPTTAAPAEITAPAGKAAAAAVVRTYPPMSIIVVDAD